MLVDEDDWNLRNQSICSQRQNERYGKWINCLIQLMRREFSCFYIGSIQTDHSQFPSTRVLCKCPSNHTWQQSPMTGDATSRQTSSYTCKPVSVSHKVEQFCLHSTIQYISSNYFSWNDAEAGLTVEQSLPIRFQFIPTVCVEEEACAQLKIER